MDTPFSCVSPAVFVSIDCAGILKLRNSDIELRKGETDIGRKNTRVRVVFRVHIPQPNGKVVSLQAASIPVECCRFCTHTEGGVKKNMCLCVYIYIYCMYFYCILYVLILYYITYNIYRNICILLSNVNYFLICILYICGETAQRSAHELPQVEKASISSCPVSGGEEMVITGSNFFPESKVIFLEKGPGKNQWGSSAILDGSFFSPYIGSLEHLFNHFCLIFCHIYHIISFISLGPILPTYFSHFIHNLNQINISYPFINLASSYALSYSQQVIISKLTPFRVILDPST